MEKTISVIMPVKDGANYLGQALESLAMQDVAMEVIVVDDGSRDATSQIAAEYGCKVISIPVSKGQVAAKNTGIAASSGEYIMFLDHDDMLRNGVLRTMRDVLDSEPAISAVQAKVKDFLSPEIDSMPGTLIRPEAYYGLFTGAILIRRSVFDVIGPFSESVHTGEIIEWKDRMDRNGFEVKKLDLISTDRRIHRSNFGKTAGKQEFKDYASILRKRLNAAKQ